MRPSRLLPWVLLAIGLASVGLAFAFSTLAGDDGDGFSTIIVVSAGVLACLGVGVLLTVRLPRQPIGWILLANALVISSIYLAASYGQYAALSDPGILPVSDWAVLYSDASWPLFFVGVTAIAYLFPDGHLPSPRWRPIATVGALSFSCMILMTPFNRDSFSAPFEEISSPLPTLPEAIYTPLASVFLLGMAVTLIGAVFALRSRFRHSDGIERLQIKWLALAAISMPLTLVGCMVEGLISGDVGWVTFLGITVVQVVVPVAIGVAVLRYRLYEIDRLISLTLTYVVLTILLALGFAAIVLAAGVALGGGSTLATAAATLVVVVAFRPLRDRIQDKVDHRFNPDRYEGLHQVDQFLTELRLGQVEPEDTGKVLAGALQDPTLQLFFWLPDENCHADAGGHLVSELPESPAGRTPLRRGDLRLGTLFHDEVLFDRPGLLEDVILKAGMAIEIARLRVEVRRQLSEVQQSRARILAAADEERKRLERDLHDGAQQRLVAIGLELRHLQHGLGKEDVKISQVLNSVVEGLAQSIEELRELAHGVRPSALDQGLAAALRELAARAPIKTDVEAIPDRFDDQVEAAVYFVASEALTNAVRHAGASRIEMVASRVNGDLILEVSDDGCGGAVSVAGSGLAGLADRVESLDGRLLITSDAGNGTRLVAELPCA